MANPKRTSSSSAGEQGDNSLYTQDNVTVPDRSWRLTATGRKQADCIGRWLVSAAAAVRPVSWSRHTCARAKPPRRWRCRRPSGRRTRVLRERYLGRDQHHHARTISATNYARNWNVQAHRPAVLAYRRPASRLPTWPEDRVHNLLTSLSRRMPRRNPWSRSPTATSCSP